MVAGRSRLLARCLLVNQWLLEKGIILERPMSGETGQKVEWVMWANSPQPSNNRS